MTRQGACQYVGFNSLVKRQFQAEVSGYMNFRVTANFSFGNGRDSIRATILPRGVGDPRAGGRPLQRRQGTASRLWGCRTLAGSSLRAAGEGAWQYVRPDRRVPLDKNEGGVKAQFCRGDGFSHRVVVVAVWRTQARYWHGESALGGSLRQPSRHPLTSAMILGMRTPVCTGARAPNQSLGLVACADQRHPRAALDTNDLWIPTIAAQHPVESNCQLPGRGHLGYSLRLPVAAMQILRTHLGIAAHRYLRRLHQQTPRIKLLPCLLIAPSRCFRPVELYSRGISPR